MIYTANFCDINDVRYTITIRTNTGNLSQNITLSEVPFEVSYQGSEDNLYKPVRYSGAKCSVLTREPHFDIYAPAAHDTKITLQKRSNNKIVWTGYVTPCLYEQGWDQDLEEVEIECIDGLSTLKYFKYSAPQRQILSFKDIICKVLNTCECYTAFYFPVNIRLNPSSNERIIEQLVISEQNFFDKKDNKDKRNDEDVAWNCDKVLEEICQYLGVTCFAEGDKVWFVDYDGILHGFNNYSRYSISGNYIDQITSEFTHTITAEDFSASGSTISLANVYNKVKVKDSPYKFDSVFPDPFQYLTNITADSDPKLARATVDDGGVGEIISNNNSNFSENTNLEALIDRAYSPDDKELVKKNNFIAVQYCTSPLVTLHRYDSNWVGQTYPTSLCYTDTQDFFGGILAKMEVQEMELYQFTGWQDLYDWFTTYKTDYQRQLDKVLKQEGKSKISLSNYIILLDKNASKNNTDTTLAEYPFVKFNSTDLNSMFGGKKAAIVISGTYIFHEFPIDPYPIPDGQVDLKNGKKKMTRSDAYLLCRMKWGNLYWNGTEWTSSPSNFKINWLLPKEENLRADGRMFKDHKIPSTVEWRAGISEEGYYIPAPEGNVLQGSPEFTIFRPKSPAYEKNQHSHKCVFLKDFSIKAVMGDPTFSDVNKSDTVYTNVINQRYVSEFKDITFKICTNDDKNPSYSTVGLRTGNNLIFIDKVYNSALASGESTWTSASSSPEQGMRFEEHLIYRLSNQYSTPTVLLKTNLHSGVVNLKGLYHSNTLQKEFILNEAKIDYKMASAQINLTEKK